MKRELISPEGLRRSFSKVREDFNNLNEYASKSVDQLDRNQQYLLQKVLELQRNMVQMEQKIRSVEQQYRLRNEIYE